MVNRNDKVLALVRDEMNMVRSMSLDEMDEYIESLLVRIINGLNDSDIDTRYTELALYDYDEFVITPGEKKVRFIIKLVAYAFIAFLVYNVYNNMVHVFNL